MQCVTSSLYTISADIMCFGATSGQAQRCPELLIGLRNVGSGRSIELPKDRFGADVLDTQSRCLYFMKCRSFLM